MFVHKLFQTAPFTHMYPWRQLATHEISHEPKTSGLSALPGRASLGETKVYYKEGRDSETPPLRHFQRWRLSWVPKVEPDVQ